MMLTGIVMALISIFVIAANLPGKSATDDKKAVKGSQSVNNNGTPANGPENPIKDLRLYIDPDSNASRQAAVWRMIAPQKAALMDKLAEQPTARWVTSPDDTPIIGDFVEEAKNQSGLPVLVAYYFPLRDCGRYSAGGAKDKDDYKDFINGLARAIGDNRAVVILEPDALAQISSTKENGQPCLNDAQQDMYFSLMSYSVDRLKKQPDVSVYIDAGNSKWVKAEDIASRLNNSNIAAADGFSLNVSNFQPIDDTADYGKDVSAKTGNKHFVIDTSRNGLGGYTNPWYADMSWCNPPGRALGHYPTTNTGNPLIDAYLFVKYPGESDGTDPDEHKCFGGPAAGTWWPEYAAGLVERWPSKLQP
jgi:endoglucanase